MKYTQFSEAKGRVKVVVSMEFHLCRDPAWMMGLQGGIYPLGQDVVGQVDLGLELKEKAISLTIRACNGTRTLTAVVSILLPQTLPSSQIKRHATLRVDDHGKRCVVCKCIEKLGAGVAGWICGYLK